MMLKRLIWAVTLFCLVGAYAGVSRAADHTEHTTGGGTTGTHTGGSEGGHGPKSDLLPGGGSDTWLSALWVVIIFMIMLAILYPTAWKNVLGGLKAREQKIRGDIAEAEAARTKAEATLREYNAQLASAEARVRDMINGAGADAQRIAAQIRAQGEQEAQEAKERATREIEAAKKQAIDEIYEQTAVLATSVAEKILRRNLNANDQKDLVTRSLDQVQNLNN
jgi:F-type H+-transporting ATPase subunit b